jgi:hypothetical protein
MVVYGRFGECVLGVYHGAGCGSRNIVSLPRDTSIVPISEVKEKKTQSEIYHGDSLIGISEAAQVKVGLSMAPLENWAVQDCRITEDPGNWMAVESVAFVRNCKTKAAIVGVVW